jgi:hypothetical protein
VDTQKKMKTSISSFPCDILSDCTDICSYIDCFPYRGEDSVTGDNRDCRSTTNKITDSEVDAGQFCLSCEVVQLAANHGGGYFSESQLQQTSTFITGLRHHQLTAPMVIDGPMDGDLFLARVDRSLCLTLQMVKVKGARMK